MNAQREILFVPLGQAACNQQLSTALYLRDRGGYVPRFLLLFPGDYQRIPDLQAHRIDFTVLDAPDKLLLPRKEHQQATASKVDEPAGGYDRLAQAVEQLRMARFLKDAGHFCMYLAWVAWRTWQTAAALQKRINLVRAKLGSRRPRLAIVSQERDLAVLPILKVLRQRRVPVLLMPAADSSPDGSARLRRDEFLLLAGLNPDRVLPHPPAALNARVVPWVNRWAGWWFADQVYPSRWGRMLYTVPSDLLALQVLGLLPRKIWYQGTSFVDYLMLSGRDELALCREAGIPPEKLLLFGSDELDALWEHKKRRDAIRGQLLHEQAWPPQRKLLIFAAPPLWEHGLVEAEEQWRSLRHILELTCTQPANVLVSLHPRSNPDHYRWMETEFPARIARRPLKDILVAGDLFVATYSSTIRWALALGLPVLNVDFWDLDLLLFAGLEGYQTVKTPAAYAQALAAWFARGQAQLPIQGDPQLVMDGRARQRLLAFIDSLASPPTVRYPSQAA